MNNLKIPFPRQANHTERILLITYSCCWFVFLKPMMTPECDIDSFQLIILIGCHLFATYIMQYKRNSIYKILCRILKKRIRFFEFFFFCTYGIITTFSYIFIPVLINNNYQILYYSNWGDNFCIYILFAGGAVLVTSIIASLSIYPVNMFKTKDSLNHLISITKDLMKVCNRGLIVVTSAIILGYIFKKEKYSNEILFATSYAILGLTLGGTAALGSRVTDMLYSLTKIEVLDTELHNIQIYNTTPDSIE